MSEQEKRFREVKVLARELGVPASILRLWAEVGLVDAVRVEKERVDEVSEFVDAEEGDWLIDWRQAFRLSSDPLLVAASREVVELLPFYRHAERALILLAHKVAVRIGLIPVREAAKILGISVKYASVLVKRKCNTVKVAGRRYVIPDLRWRELLAERSVDVAELAEREFEPLAFIKSVVSWRQAGGWVEISGESCYNHEWMNNACEGVDGADEQCSLQCGD